jgi:hypothetical protein
MSGVSDSGIASVGLIVPPWYRRTLPDSAAVTLGLAQALRPVSGRQAGAARLFLLQFLVGAHQLGLLLGLALHARGIFTHWRSRGRQRWGGLLRRAGR